VHKHDFTTLASTVYQYQSETYPSDSHSRVSKTPGVPSNSRTLFLDFDVCKKYLFDTSKPMFGNKNLRIPVQDATRPAPGERCQGDKQHAIRGNSKPFIL
jgi:hypothetical protein